MLVMLLVFHPHHFFLHDFQVLAHRHFILRLEFHFRQKHPGDNGLYG